MSLIGKHYREKPETYWPFEKARDWARQSDIRTCTEWFKADLPEGIPRRPQPVYKNQWVSWPYFLGNEKIWLPFEEASEWARESEIKTCAEWRKANLPEGIPCSPRHVYKDQWNDWYDFLGKEYLPFEEVRKWARTSGLKTSAEWKSANLSKGMPLCPQKVYKGQWVSWPDFLGTGRGNRIVKNNYLPFEEARELARKSKIKTGPEWFKADLPEGVPRTPWNAYKDQWKGWKDFLGTEWLSFKEARGWTRQSGIKKILEWKKADLPDGIPKHPERVYKDQWIDWYDWMGKERLS